MLQYCFDPGTEKTCEDRSSLVVNLKTKRKRKMPSPQKQVMNYLTNKEAKVTKSQVVVGTAAIVAAVTGGYFYAKR